MSDIHYTNIMLEFEKLTTLLNKLEKELAEFKKTVYPKMFQDGVNIAYALSDGSLVDSTVVQLKLGGINEYHSK